MKAELINQINEGVLRGKKKGLSHQYTSDEKLNGTHINIDGQTLYNFQSCSYLGLELDNRLINASIEALLKYGTQLSCSRTFLSCGLYAELEELTCKIFGEYTLLTQSTSLGHSSVMPLIMNEGDLVIFDQQSHVSMQDVIPHLKSKKVDIKVIRHNNLESLNHILNKNKNKYKKIWYVIDGVYSMYGDYAPIKQIFAIIESFQNTYVYCDDAHGMSWAGENGSGYIRSKVGKHKQLILAVSLAKAAGSAGGVFNFPEKWMYDAVRPWGRAMSWSGPQQPAVIGASIASLKIHLSKEIIFLQNELQTRVDFIHKSFEEFNIPVLSSKGSPVVFIPLGTESLAINLANRLRHSGYFVDVAKFPAVSELRSGIRICITNHFSLPDIEGLCYTIYKNFSISMKEESKTFSDIQRAFKGFNIKNLKIEKESKVKSIKRFKVYEYDSIISMEEEEWNKLMLSRTNFSYEDMLMLENSFKNNHTKNENWDFKYIEIKDKEGKTVLLTYFTNLKMKDDALSERSISQKVEKVRENKKDYLVSSTIMMGCLLSTGTNIYFDKTQNWKDSVVAMLNTVWNWQYETGALNLILKNYNYGDNEMLDFLTGQGFLRQELPEEYIIDLSFSSVSDYLKSLKYDGRRLIKNEVKQNESLFNVKVGEVQLEQFEERLGLFRNVESKALEVNNFPLPKKLFKNIEKNLNNWEVIEIEFTETNTLVAVLYSQFIDGCYRWHFIGMDYDYVRSHHIYKQAIYQLIKRAISLGATSINMGVTTRQIKKKFGAKVNNSYALVQTNNSFNQSLINLLNI